MAKARGGGLEATYERAALARGLGPVAGVDEVGRGPLAGPVVTAAVILDLDHVPLGLGDSKTIPRAGRETLSAAILASARAIAIGTASPREIDALNIRAATHLAMRRAVAALSLRPGLVLVDGRDTAGLSGAVEAIVKGDARVASIAAAAIVAKVARDRMMARLDSAHPGYGFAGHAGYGVPAHLAALEALGPSPAHRFSFAPIRGRWTTP